jgi:hypothetical protein
VQSVQEQINFDTKARNVAEKIAMDTAEERIALKEQELKIRESLAAESARYTSSSKAEEVKRTQMKKVSEQVRKSIEREGQKHQEQLADGRSIREKIAATRAVDVADREEEIDKVAKETLEAHADNTDVLVRKATQAGRSVSAAKLSSEVALNLTADARVKEIDAKVTNTTAAVVARKAAELRVEATRSREEYQKVKAQADEDRARAKEAREAFEAFDQMAASAQTQAMTGAEDASRELSETAAEGQVDVQNALNQAMKAVEEAERKNAAWETENQGSDVAPALAPCDCTMPCAASKQLPCFGTV